LASILVSYNGKELQEEFGLGVYDYGARNYDVAFGILLIKGMYHDSNGNATTWRGTKKALIKYNGKDSYGNSVLKKIKP